ncbi:MAG: hypothetical protein QOE92_1025 [Chloroflexota bacterium]|jgi:sporulation protein YlmC with PRC-barrel domain|nr:hypothetical protein [Chloroflexota bacterium]
MSPRPRTVRIADLVGSRIIDADGHSIGRVIDLAVTDGPPYRLTEILSGPWEWLDRLEVLGVLSRHLRGHPDARHVPWEDVKSFDGRVVRLSTTPRR